MDDCGSGLSLPVLTVFEMELFRSQVVTYWTTNPGVTGSIPSSSTLSDETLTIGPSITFLYWLDVKSNSINHTLWGFGQVVGQCSTIALQKAVLSSCLYFTVYKPVRLTASIELKL